MKNLNKIIFVILILPLLLMLNACSVKSAKKVNKLVSKSLTNIKTATEVVEMYDGDVLVFKQSKVVTYQSGDNAHVIIEKYELSPIATLEKTSQESDEEVKRNNLFVLNLSKENVKNQTSEGSTYKCQIEKANMQEVLGSSTLDILGDINVEISFNDKLVEKVNCTMVSKSGKDVKISTTYTY